jgi:hypothetical protein
LLKEDWDERLRIEKVATLENNPVNASATCPKPSSQPIKHWPDGTLKKQDSPCVCKFD